MKTLPFVIFLWIVLMSILMAIHFIKLKTLSCLLQVKSLWSSFAFTVLLCVCPTHATRDLGKVYTHNLRLSSRDSLLPGSQLSYFQVAMTTPPLSFCNPGKKDDVFHNRASAILSQATTADCFRVWQLSPLESLLSDSPLLYKICLPFLHSQKPSSASPVAEW